MLLEDLLIGEDWDRRHVRRVPLEAEFELLGAASLLRSEALLILRGQDEVTRKYRMGDLLGPMLWDVDVDAKEDLASL